jgi:serine/threonine protein kinase
MTSTQVLADEELQSFIHEAEGSYSSIPTLTLPERHSAVEHHYLAENECCSTSHALPPRFLFEPAPLALAVQHSSGDSSASASVLLSPQRSKTLSRIRSLASMPSSPCLSPHASFDVQSSPLLGRGASGAVRIVFNNDLGRNTATKTVRFVDENRIRAAMTELEFAKRVLALADTHEHLWNNIVELFEVQLLDEEQEVVLVMEHLEEGTVAQLPCFARSPMRSFIHAEYELPLARVVRDVLLGLKTLHDDLRVLHRDLKPENILIAADGTAKLADFGVAALLPPDRDDADDQVGTYLYMSPERLRGDRHGPKADVWSLGVTALQLALYGKYPLLALTGDQGNRFWSLVDALGATEGESHCREVVLERVEAALDEIAGLRGNASPAFRDFIRAALSADSEERASVDALLGHEWLQRTFSSK